MSACFLLFALLRSGAASWLALCAFLGVMDWQTGEVDVVVEGHLVLRWGERRAMVALFAVLVALKIVRAVLWWIPLYATTLFVLNT